MRAQDWQRDIEQYDFHFSTTPLYAQLDMERHVNNVAVQSFHCEARLRLQMSVLGERSWCSDGVRLRPRRSVTQFIGETHYLDDVTAAARLVALDGDGYRLALGLFQNGECVGVQECLMGAWLEDRWVDLPEAVATPLAGLLNPPPSLSPWPEPISDDDRFEGYPRRSGLLMRYADMDPDHRLGELSMARFIEQSRANSLNMVRMPGLGMLVARIDLRYLRWDKGLADIALPSGIARIGNSSFAVRGGILADGETVAIAESVVVLLDRETHRPTPVTAAMREAMSEVAV